MKLTIKNLQYGDFGNYRCISKNSLGETEGSIRVYGKRFTILACAQYREMMIICSKLFHQIFRRSLTSFFSFFLCSVITWCANVCVCVCMCRLVFFRSIECIFFLPSFFFIAILNILLLICSLWQ